MRTAFCTAISPPKRFSRTSSAPSLGTVRRPHERRIHVRIRLARRFLGVCGGCSARAICRSLCSAWRARLRAIRRCGIAAMREAGWEIASHGLKWIDYKDFSRSEDEATHMRQ